MTPAPLPQRRRTGRVTAGAVGALGVAAAAAFGVHAAVTPTTVVGQASPAQGVPSPAGFVPGYRPGGPGWSTGGSGGTSSTATTTATAAQQVGIVEINTVLQYRHAQAAGTGMVLTSDGEILTNNHVVNGATKITVTVVSTGATYTANVVGTDPSDDVAVLQLSDASGLQTAKPRPRTRRRSATRSPRSATPAARRHPDGRDRHGHRGRPVDHRLRRGRLATPSSSPA